MRFPVCGVPRVSFVRECPGSGPGRWVSGIGPGTFPSDSRVHTPGREAVTSVMAGGVNGGGVVGEPPVPGPEGLRLPRLRIPHDAEPVLAGFEAHDVVVAHSEPVVLTGSPRHRLRSQAGFSGAKQCCQTHRTAASSAAAGMAVAVRVRVRTTAILFFHLASVAEMTSRIFCCCSRTVAVWCSLSLESMFLAFVLIASSSLLARSEVVSEQTFRYCSSCSSRSLLASSAAAESRRLWALSSSSRCWAASSRFRSASARSCSISRSCCSRFSLVPVSRSWSLPEYSMASASSFSLNWAIVSLSFRLKFRFWSDRISRMALSNSRW